MFFIATQIILLLLIQLVYVPLYTLRTIFLVKGISLAASFFAFIESLIYVFGLTIVLTGDNPPIVLVFYACGFSLGILLGGYVERKLAIGYTCLSVNLMNVNHELINALRDCGYGVTFFEGEGKNGKRCRLEILTKRSCENHLMNAIELYEPKAFIISYEPRRFKGGYLVKAMGKKTQNKIDSSKEKPGLIRKLFKTKSDANCQTCNVDVLQKKAKKNLNDKEKS